MSFFLKFGLLALDFGVLSSESPSAFEFLETGALEGSGWVSVDSSVAPPS